MEKTLKENFKIGDTYELTTYKCFEFLCKGGLIEDYKGKKFYESKIKYITPTNGLILEIDDEDVLYDDGVSPSLFYGKEIKEYYMDFDGDDETLYCVMYEDESPFYN